MLKITNIRTRLIIIVLSVLVLNSILKETLDTILDTIDIQNAKIYYSLKIFSKTLIIILTFFLIKKYNYSISVSYTHLTLPTKA